MFKVILLGVAMTGALVATPYAVDSFQNSVPPCLCCGETCSCELCVCETAECECDAAGDCACALECCNMCCSN
jgi:hypothetical protein